MFTATMDYHFRPERFEEACSLWNSLVLDKARGRKGLVRMQFLAAPPRAMAIGVWESKDDAEAFMQTGVFRDLMARYEGMLADQPKPLMWELRYSAG